MFPDERQLSFRFLQHNQIRELPNDMFSNTESLVWLLFDHNRLHNLDLMVFSSLENLQLLELSNNNITLKSTTFPKLPALNEL